MLLTKIAFKNLKGNASFTFFFILNMSVGLAGYTMLDGFKRSLGESIESASKEMTTADLQISGRLTFSDEQISKVKKALDVYTAEHSHVTALFSMAAHEKQSRLVEVKAVERNFPMYGQLVLKEQPLQKTIHDGQFAYIYPELFQQLGVKLGDHISIGSSKFEILGTVEKDAGASWAAASVAPRVYVSRSFLQKTDLIQKGSSIWNYLLYRVKDDSMIELAKEAARKVLPEKGIRVQGHLDVGQQSGRLIRYLNDYLGLVTLAAFFLAAIGAAFLYRNYLNSKLASTATLMSLGLNPVQAFWVSILEILMLSIASVLASLSFAFILLPLLPDLLGDFLPMVLNARIGLQSILSSFILATVGSLTVCLPLIRASWSHKASTLFQEARQDSVKVNLTDWIFFLPGILLFWLISCWQSKSMLVGTLFFILFSLGGGLLYALGRIILNYFGQLSGRFNYPLKSAFLYMNRQKFSSITCFLSLALGAMLTSLIPSLRESIYSELERPDGNSLPSFFLFDIQDEQAEGVRKNLKANNATSSLLSPLVRAELKKVNGKVFEAKKKSEGFETREQERTRAFTNRTMNLTYRAKPIESETIIEGKFWTEGWSPQSKQLPQISIEKRFADRLSLEMGDVLDFEVLGVPVSGKITSVRKIKWTTFQPNFFVQFQPGVFENAPKTFVGAVNKIEDPDQKVQIQAKIVKEFPNVSIIDVSRIVQRLMEIIDKMSWALTFMALMCLLTGCIVLYSICRHQINTRIWDISMMKVLGADFNDIKKGIVAEFFLISFFAAMMGTSMSLLVSLFLSKVVFEGVFVMNILIPISITIGVTFIGVFVSHNTARRILKLKPLQYLKI